MIVIDIYSPCTFIDRDISRCWAVLLALSAVSEAAAEACGGVLALAFSLLALCEHLCVGDVR